MSANRAPRHPTWSEKEAARWLAQARKKRQLPDYAVATTHPEYEPRRCHDCNVVIRGKQTRCAPCQAGARRRNEDARQKARQKAERQAEQQRKAA